MNKKEKKKLHSSELKLPDLKFSIPIETRQYEIQLDKCELCQYSPMCHIQRHTITNGSLEIVESEKIPCPFFKHYEPFQEYVNEDDEELKKLEKIQKTLKENDEKFLKRFNEKIMEYNNGSKNKT